MSCENGNQEVTTSNSSSSEFTENGKNKNDVKCSRCASLILRSGAATLVEHEESIPSPHAKSDKSEYPSETLKRFWHVNNMYTFENIGFSHTVANRKFLVCADCEVGPIGYHDIPDSDGDKSFYVAVDRVTNS